MDVIVLGKRKSEWSPSQTDQNNYDDDDDDDDDDEIKWYSHVANPHLEQCKLMSNGIMKFDEDKLSRVLSNDACRLQYRRRQDEIKSVVHWGQRKLLICEIEFLTKFAVEGITCIYAGAAPGTHIPFLSQLFPEIHFVLIDPSDFSIEPNSHITTRQEFMNNEIASEFKHMKTLFISDVRSADWRTMSEIELEDCIRKDMTSQMDWHVTLKPIASLLKFRLPWTSGSSRYLDGELYLPVWGPQTTTESRLLVTTENLIEYDHDTYNERMFFFNNNTRVCAFKHDVIDVDKINDCVVISHACSHSTDFHVEVEVEEGVDFCYDCSSEIKVLKDYLKSTPHRWASHCPSPLPVPLLTTIEKSMHTSCHDSDETTGNSNDPNFVIKDYNKELSERKLVVGGTRRLMAAITLACNGKNGPRSRSFRTLLNWRRTHDFRKKVYDTENCTIIELPDTVQTTYR